MKALLFAALALGGCADLKAASKECGAQATVEALKTAVPAVAQAIACDVATPGELPQCAEDALKTVAASVEPVVFQCALEHIHDATVKAAAK